MQLLVLLSGRAAPNREDAFHTGIEQTFAQDTLSDHTRRAKENYFHVWITSQLELAPRGVSIRADYMIAPGSSPIRKLRHCPGRARLDEPDDTG
jgi:hypothetical protein